jgi:acyl-coenzyme A thioesterase PaaI-like protein
MTAPEGLVPEGFERHTRRSGLTEPWEPIYARRSTDGVSLAIRAGAAHANSRGFVHGGLITALADNAMGLSCGEQVANAPKWSGHKNASDKIGV